MSGNYKKEDLRIVKTRKALANSLYTLLKRRKFDRITVNDLCEEALISRATFYIHFCDKYSLLNYCLDDIRDSLVGKIHYFTYERIEIVVNQFICENAKAITHLAEDAGREVLDLLRGFMFSIIDILFSKEKDTGSAPNNVVLYNFCSGGMVNLLLWQIENKFPPESQLMNTYLFDMLKYIMTWGEKTNEDILNHND